MLEFYQVLAIIEEFLERTNDPTELCLLANLLIRLREDNEVAMEHMAADYGARQDARDAMEGK